MIAVMKMRQLASISGRALALLVLVASASLSLVAPAGARTTARPFYELARVRWLSEAQMVSSAAQNIPLISAVHDLKLGLAKGGDTTEYLYAINTIEAFESIPITSETKKQMRASHRDWSLLNAFFGVGKREGRVLMDEFPSGEFFDRAQRYFDKEPSGLRGGDRADLLESAVSALRREARAQKPRAILFEAAIADLINLQSASATQIATSESNLLNPYRQDIDYLDTLFETERLGGLGGSPS
jgi:hypothetical protein